MTDGFALRDTFSATGGSLAELGQAGSGIDGQAACGMTRNTNFEF